jgi:hypothetical protein
MFAEECSGGIILRKKLAEGNKDVMKCYTGPQTRMGTLEQPVQQRMGNVM